MYICENSMSWVLPSSIIAATLFLILDIKMNCILASRAVEVPIIQGVPLIALSPPPHYYLSHSISVHVTSGPVSKKKR